MNNQIQFSDDEEDIIYENKDEIDEEEDEWDEEMRQAIIALTCNREQNFYEMSKPEVKKKKKVKKIKKSNKIFLQFNNKVDINQYTTNKKKKWESKRIKDSNKNKKKEYKFNPRLPPWDFRILDNKSNNTLNKEEYPELKV